MSSQPIPTPGGLFASIEDRLTAGEGQRAARMLLDAISGRLLVAGLSLDEWLAGLDEQARSKLVSAFAHYPCFACLNGMEQCDGCGGSGFAAVARVCAPCAGLGSKRCDFCNGSGLATYNVIPAELRTHVLVARAARAGRYLEKLLKQRMTGAGEAAAVRHAQDLNQLLGVLENAVVSAQQLAAAGILLQPAVDRFTATCHRSAAAGLTRLRETLVRLSQVYRERSPLLPPIDAENAEAKSEFYDELAQSKAFEGTGLSHPFLPASR